jgi:uncharacterized membrane protein YoaK (UPF0700 family)
MLRHSGAKRTLSHNIRLAVLLCLTAGFINAAGFLAFGVLTTNVTGHAALLAMDIAAGQLRAERMVGLWLVLFLAGAFLSGLIISLIGRDKAASYAVPIVIIVILVLFVAITGIHYDHSIPQTEYFTGSLLFAMGMQNALVTVVSGSVVRTTHLTGMFTDLGIDLSALVTRNGVPQEVKSRITLRLIIIVFFLLGGVVGGLTFSSMGFHSFFFPVSLLIIALFYDYLRIGLFRTFSRK